MSCNTSWIFVDHVLIPIFMEKEKHWILGHFILKDSVIMVYNSMGTPTIDRVVMGALEPILLLLPYFLELVGFYDRPHIDFKFGTYSGKRSSDPFHVKLVHDLPQQTYM